MKSTCKGKIPKPCNYLVKELGADDGEIWNGTPNGCRLVFLTPVLMWVW